LWRARHAGPAFLRSWIHCCSCVQFNKGHMGQLKITAQTPKSHNLLLLDTHLRQTRGVMQFKQAW
jgi:hypothetical protein